MRILALILTMTFIADKSYARFAEISEAYYKYFQQHSVIIDKEGNAEIRSTQKLTALKHAVLESMGSFPLTKTYYDNYTDINAHTIKKDSGTKITADQKTTDRAPGNGFDSTKDILIKFKDLEVGDSIELSSSKNTTPAHINYFDDRQLLYNNGILEAGTSWSYTSDIPLFFGLHDPNHLLDGKIKIKKWKDELGKHQVSITIIEDILLLVVSETHADIHGLQKPYFVISTKEKENEIIDQETKDAYWEVINEGLSFGNSSIEEFLDDLLRKERNLNRDSAKIIEFMIKKLSLTYFGSWETKEGKLTPRKTTDVLSTKWGDCKDSSSTMVILLKRLGYNASPALVKRGGLSLRGKLDGVAHSDFNHVFVHVEQEGKDFYFDPTNNLAYTDTIPEDIKNRNAIILCEEDRPRLGKVGFFNPSEHYDDQKTYTDKKNSESYTTSIAYEFEGELAVREHIDMKFDSTGLFSHSVYKKLSPATGVSTSEMRRDKIREILLGSHKPKLYDFKPELKDEFESLAVPYKTTLVAKAVCAPNIIPFNSTADCALQYRLPEFYHNDLGAASFHKVENDYLLSYLPLTRSRKIVIKNMRADEQSVENKNKWWTASLSIKQVGNDVVVERKMEIKRAVIIESKDLNSTEFQESLEIYKELMGTRGIMLSRADQQTQRSILQRMSNAPKSSFFIGGALLGAFAYKFILK